MMDVQYLLTATRSARKSLDTDAPVDVEDIRECLRIGLQAANGSNQQSWRWLVIGDPGLRNEMAELWAAYVPGPPSGRPVGGPSTRSSRATAGTAPRSRMGTSAHCAAPPSRPV
jgi:nitroreductase